MDKGLETEKEGREGRGLECLQIQLLDRPVEPCTLGSQSDISSCTALAPLRTSRVSLGSTETGAQ